MLSESWCFEQKVQEKGGMERKIVFPWSNFCTMKKDVLVVSFNLVRPAGALTCAVYSFCCHSPNRQLGCLFGLFVRAEVCIVVTSLAYGC